MKDQVPAAPAAAADGGQPASPTAPSPRSATTVWLPVIGTLAVVAALALAREFLVPVALAGLITFLMSPAVLWLERRIGRVPAVLGAVFVVFAVLAGSGWMLLRQLDGVAEDLPRYRIALRTKISELRAASDSGTVAELQKTIDSVQEDLAAAADPTPSGRVVVAERAAENSPFGALGPMAGLAASAGLVIALVIFMLLERRTLRDRIVKVAGRGHVAVTTRALDEAGRRVARHLRMQMLVNTIYGVTAGVGLWLLDVPYPLVWATLGGVLRFVPYVGPLVGGTAPVLIAVASMDGWSGPLQVIALMIALELFTNLVLETVLYAGAAGVSQAGLLVAVTFWTWIWGSAGLLMAIPLTVCLVVLGKHVHGLEYLATLMSDEPALSPRQTYYQRLLLKDTGEASEIVQQHLETHPPRSVYDALLLPALVLAEADRLAGRLDAAGVKRFVDAARDMAAFTADQVRRAVPPHESAVTNTARLHLLGFGMSGEVDDLALDVLARMVDDLPIDVERRPKLLASEVPAWTRENDVTLICIADMVGGPASRTRLLVKRLRQALPEMTILVGRWGVDTTPEEMTALSEAGANHVALALEQTRAYLADRVTAAGGRADVTETAATDQEPQTMVTVPSEAV